MDDKIKLFSRKDFWFVQKLYFNLIQIMINRPLSKFTIRKKYITKSLFINIFIGGKNKFI